MMHNLNILGLWTKTDFSALGYAQVRLLPFINDLCLRLQGAQNAIHGLFMDGFVHYGRLKSFESRQLLPVNRSVELFSMTAVLRWHLPIS